MAEKGLTIPILADMTSFEKSMSSLSKKVGDVGKSLSKKLTLPITAIGTLATKCASDLKQTEQRVKTIFGDMEDEVWNWANESERALGLGAGTIAGMTSGFADLTMGLGMTAEASREMGQEATEMAVILGNWANTSPADAMADIQRAVMGSTEAMEKYGVKLNENVLNEKTRAMGLGDSFNKLTEVEKAQVRYNAIISASGNAIKHWEDGNRSLSFTLGEVKEQFTNIMENIGKVILPVVEVVVKKIADMTANFAKFTADNPKFTQSLVVVGGVLASLGPILMVVSKAMLVFSKIGLLFSPIGLAIAGAMAIAGVSFIGLNENAQNVMSELPNKITEGLNSFLQKIVEVLPSILEKGTEIIMKLIEGLMTGLPILIETGVNILMNLIETFFTYAPQFINIAFNWIQNLITGITQSFPTLLSNFITRITEIIQNIASRMPEFLQKGIEFVSNLASGFASNFPALIQKGFELLSQLIQTILQHLPEILMAGVELILSFIQGIWENRDQVIQAIKDIITGMLEGVKSMVSGFLQVGKDIVNGIIDGVKSMISSAVNVVKNLGSKMMEGIKGMLGIHSPSRVFRQYGVWTGQGLALGLGDSENMVDKATNSLGNIVTKAGSGIFSTFDTMAMKIADMSDISINATMNASKVQRYSEFHIGAKKEEAVIENIITLDGRVLTDELSPRFDIASGSRIKLSGRRMGVK